MDSTFIPNSPSDFKRKYKSAFNSPKSEYKINLVSPPSTPKSFNGRRGRTLSKFDSLINKTACEHLNNIQNLTSNLIHNLETQSYTKITFSKPSIKEMYDQFNDIINMYIDDASHNRYYRVIKTQNFPSVTPKDRLQAIYLSHALEGAINELIKEFPNYVNTLNDTSAFYTYNPRNLNVVKENKAAFKRELSIWTYIFSEAIQQISIHSKSMGILFDTIHQRFVGIIKFLFKQNPKEKLTFEDIFHDFKSTSCYDFSQFLDKFHKTLDPKLNETEIKPTDKFHGDTLLTDFTNQVDDTSELNNTFVEGEDKANNDLDPTTISYKLDEPSEITLQEKKEDSDKYAPTVEEFNEFCDQIDYLLNYFASSTPKNPRIIFLQQTARKMHLLVCEKDSLSKENKMLKETLSKLTTQNNQMIKDKFDLIMEKKESDDNLNAALELNDSLRERIISREQLIRDLKIKSDIISQPESIGIVPECVQRIWHQISTLCKSFLSGNFFDSIDLNSYLPLVIPKNYTPPSFSIEKRRFTHNQKLHYVSLFTDIKSQFDEQVLLSIESKFDSFFKMITTHYINNFKIYKEDQKKVSNNLMKKLENIRNNQTNDSKFIHLFFDSKGIIKIPKSMKDVSQISNTIKNIYTFVVTKVNPLSEQKNESNNKFFRFNKKIPNRNSNQASKVDSMTCFKNMNDINNVFNIIQKYYQQSPSKQLFIFLAQISAFSQKDIEIDLFKQFLLETIPYHCFLFYSQIYFKSKDFRKNGTQLRMKLIEKYFNCVGWNSIEKQKKDNFYLLFFSDQIKFTIFCLALYLFVIEKISQTITDIDSEEKIEEIIKEHLGFISENDMLEKMEFMKKISVTKNHTITSTEVAVVLFNYKTSFNELITSFKAEDSHLLQYLVNFGVKPPKRRNRKVILTHVNTVGDQSNIQQFGKTMTPQRREISVGKSLSQTQREIFVRKRYPSATPQMKSNLFE